VLFCGRTRYDHRTVPNAAQDNSFVPWPHLWLSNAQANGASGRIKEKQGARLIDRKPSRYVSGEGTRMVWLLTREDWLARRPRS
jgi:hypothetical protein